MQTIIVSPGRDCVLIIFVQLYASKPGLFKANLFWIGQYDLPNFHIGKRTNPILI